MKDPVTRRFGLIFCCFLFLTFPLAAFANDYYVSPSGSDSNNGSQGSPWKTIQHSTSAFSLGSNGTVIHVAAGTYASGIDMTRGGTASARLVLRCDPGLASATAARGQCKITGGGFGVLVEASYVDVRGFDIGGDPDMNVAVDTGCPTSGGPGAPATCPGGGPSQHVVGNYIHDLSQNVSGGAGLPAGCPDDGAINELKRGYLLQDQQYIGNFIKNVGAGFPSPVGGNCSNGIDLSAGGGAIVQNNVVINTATTGIADHGSCGYVFTNNVVISTTDAFVLNHQDAGTYCPNGLGLNTVANNYSANVVNHYYQSSGAPDCVSGRATLYSHNITDGAGNDFSPTRSSCDVVTPTGMSHQAGTSFFVNYKTDGSGDYHLKSSSMGVQAGSPQCVGGGTSPCTPSMDLEGVARTSSPSVGAYEVDQGASQLAPPTGLTAQVK
jgi:hypothetical protein